MSDRDSLEEQLYNAVGDLKLSEVIDLLAQGADVNYRIPRERFRRYRDTNDDEIKDGIYASQPYSALRLVVFRCSDTTLEYLAPHLKSPEAELKEIAKVLLAHGADADDAYELLVDRYGYGYPYDEWEDDLAMSTLNMITRHRKHQDSLEEKLVAAVYTANFEKVSALLAQGANANHRIPAEPCPSVTKYSGVAYSPLRIVVCVLSSFYGEALEPEKKNPCVELGKIASALLAHGADAHDAHELILDFYGEKSQYKAIWKDKDATAVLKLIAQHIQEP